MSEFSDRELGMDRAITRRDFVNGMAIGIRVLGAGQTLRAQPGTNYPPEKTGVRGSHSEGLAEQGPSKNGAFPTWTKKLRPGFVPALICSALPHNEGIWPI